MPPGKDSDDWLTTLRSGMWRLYYQLSAEGRRRYFGELLPVLHQTKHEVMGDRDDDCYYLVYLGTKPSGQRRGYGRKLIDHMAAKVRLIIVSHLHMSCLAGIFLVPVLLLYLDNPIPPPSPPHLHRINTT